MGNTKMRCKPTGIKKKKQWLNSSGPKVETDKSRMLSCKSSNGKKGRGFHFKKYNPIEKHTTQSPHQKERTL